MTQIIDLEVRRENRRLKAEVVSLKWQLQHFIKLWSKTEDAEIKALLELEELKRRGAGA